MGTRLLLKFRSRRNWGINDNRQCRLCGDVCKYVVHVLWECPVYGDIREVISQTLGQRFAEFDVFN